MSPTGPLYPSTAANVSVGANAWVTPANGEVTDGVFTVSTQGTPGSGSDKLQLTNFGFALPSYAVIDGFFVEIEVKSVNAATAFIGLLKASAATGTAKSDFPVPATTVWPATEAWLPYGGATDLWGATLTPTDVNGSGFGIWLQAQNTHAGGTASVDSVRITIYWHAAPTNIPRDKYYVYKVFDSLTESYLGNLPNVTSEFALGQDINTAGTHIDVACGVSADTSGLAVDTLTDEAGNTLTDEASSSLTSEGRAPYTGTGNSGALIRDGNRLQVWEYGYYHVNGLCMFSGVIERHVENFGGDTGNDNVTLVAYSDGSDMNNHLVRGYPYTYTLDQSQAVQNAGLTVDQSAVGAGWDHYGQTFETGLAVTNLAAITLLLLGTADVTVNVYDGPSAVPKLLASVTQHVSVGAATEVQFDFASPLTVAGGSTLFFAVTVAGGQSITLYYDTSTAYVNGSLYLSAYGGAGGGAWAYMVGSLYFKTYSGTGSTTATFSSMDPTTGMLQTIMNAYLTEGGSIGIGNLQATGLSLNWGFNTNTVYDGVQGMLDASPAGFYYYVDVGADLLYFQQASTTADIVLTKGVHISKLSIVSTIEYVINACYVVGKVVAGVSVYTLDKDPTSISLYGLRIQVHTDNNIPDGTAAHAVGSSVVTENKDEQYQTSVTIPDKTMDTTLLVPGKVIGFNGFGTYVDGLLAQIVHRDYAPGAVTLTLGILPKRLSVDTDQVVRGLDSLNTITNPSAPS